MKKFFRSAMDKARRARAIMAKGYSQSEAAFLVGLSSGHSIATYKWRHPEVWDEPVDMSLAADVPARDRRQIVTSAEATAFHISPKKDRGPCPICGFRASLALHRLIGADEAADLAGARWIKRRRHPRGSWYDVPIGADGRPVPKAEQPEGYGLTDLSRERIRRAVAMRARGATFRRIADALGIQPQDVTKLRHDYRAAWAAEWARVTLGTVEMAKARREPKPAAGEPCQPVAYTPADRPTVRQFVEHAYIPQHLALAPRSAEQLRIVARKFQEHAGPVPIADVTDDQCTAFLRSMLADGKHAATTINSRRRELVTILRFAWKKRFRDEVPRDVPRVRELRKLPVAWTVDEISNLVGFSGRLSGSVGPCLACHFWPALELVAYWTGARIGDILRIGSADVDLERGEILVCASKTGKQKLYRIHHQAVEAVRAIYDPRRELLFDWPYSPGHLFVVFRSIVVAAGIPYDGQARGLFHRLRRTNLSYCWAADRRLAQDQADHGSERTTRAHYIDPRIAVERSAADVLPVPDFAGEGRLRVFA